MLLAVLLGVGLWLARASLLGWLVERVLADENLGPATVEVLELAPSHAALALRGSALGSIARVDIAYRLGLRPRIDKLRVSGARLQFAWRDGQLFPSVGGGDSGTPAPRLHIELVDTRVTLRVGATPLQAQIAGVLESGARPAAQLRFEITAPQGHGQGTLAAQSLANGELEAVLTLAAGDVRVATLQALGLTGSLRARHGAQGLAALEGKINLRQLMSPRQSWGAGHISIAQAAPFTWRLGVDFTPLKLDLQSAQTDAQARRDFTLNGKLDAHLLGALLPGLAVTAGQLSLAAHGDMPAGTASLSDALRDAHMRATLRMHATRLELPEVLQMDALVATLDCGLASATLTCGSEEGIHLTGLRFAPGVVAADSMLAAPGALTIAASDAAPLAKLSTVRDGGELTLSSTLSLETAKLTVHAPLTLRLGIEPGAADVDTPATTRNGRFALQGHIDAEQPPGQPWLAPHFSFDGHYTLDTATRTLRTAALDSGQLELPRQGWAARALHATYAAAATDRLIFVIDELRSTREPAQLTTLKAELDAHIAPDTARLALHLGDAGGRIDIQFDASHQRRGGTGEAKLVMRPIVLAGADSLRALSPALAAGVSDARGAISVAGSAQWGAGPQRSQLALQLHDLALATPALKVTALEARLDLDNLAPLHSARGQTLRATFELPALGRVPLELRFSVADQHLRLEHARAEVFNGAFETDDGTVDVASGASRIDLRVVDVDLASVFTVLNLEQMKGSGRVSGRLPLRFEGGHIAVEQGQMQASGPGVVQIGASALTSQLQSYGKDVDLAFRALSDFHYQSLAISADKPLLGAGKALFHMQGNNPAVMDGQPFNFNISLETDFDYLARLLLELSGITNSALGWSAGEMLKQ